MLDLIDVLLIDYIKQNRLKFFIYLLTILFIFPLESAYLSKLYGDLFESIGKFSNLHNKKPGNVQIYSHLDKI